MGTDAPSSRITGKRTNSPRSRDNIAYRAARERTRNGALRLGRRLGRRRPRPKTSTVFFRSHWVCPRAGGISSNTVPRLKAPLSLAAQAASARIPCRYCRWPRPLRLRHSGAKACYGPFRAALTATTQRPASHGSDRRKGMRTGSAGLMRLGPTSLGAHNTDGGNQRATQVRGSRFHSVWRTVEDRPTARAPEPKRSVMEPDRVGREGSVPNLTHPFLALVLRENRLRHCKRINR
jgi:hypothetical protein